MAALAPFGKFRTNIQQMLIEPRLGRGKRSLVDGIGFIDPPAVFGTAE